MKFDKTLATQIELLHDLRLDNWAEKLASARERLSKDECRILLIGEFSRGKTSFLNALIGKELLYTSALPVTTENVVCYGKTPDAQAMIDSSLQPVPIEALADNMYKRVELSYPLPLCQNDVVLHELPSMSETYEEFKAAARQADVVVVVMACDALFSVTEKEMANDLKGMGHRQLYFLCNFVDRLPVDQRDAVRQSAYVRLPANPEQIFFISAEQALDGNADAVAAIKAVEQALANAAADVVETKRDRTAWLLEKSVEAAQESLQEMRTAVSHQQSQAEDKASRLHAAYQDAATAGSRVQADFEDFRQQTHDVLHAMVGSFVRDLGQQVDVWSQSYTGDDLSRYMTTQIRREVQTWQQQSLQPYLHQQVIQQEQTLKNGVAAFGQRLDHLYELADEESAVSDLQITIAAPNVENISVETGAADFSPAPGSQIDLLRMPETLLTLTASVAAMLLVRPFILGLPLGAAGVGVAFWLGRSRLQNQDNTAHSNAVRAYVQIIRSQANKISLSVWEGVNEQLTAVQAEIDELLSDQLQRARKLVASAQTAILPDAADQLEDYARRLDEIEHAIEPEHT